MPKYKADEYLRVSYAADRSEESDSISNQKKLIEDFVAAHPDIEIVSERVDDGYSGVLFDRPAFQEMMADIMAGKINCVIVKDLSRLGREYIETGRYLRQIFPAYGVRFIAINDGIDTANEHNGDDLNISMKNLLNDTYCRDISVKTRSALLSKRKNGDYVGACPIYGYRKDPENRNHLVIDDYAAHVVQDIYRRRIDGASAQRIANELNRRGILSPLAYKVNRGLPHPTGGYADVPDAKWSAKSVIRILQEETYTGVLLQGKQETYNHKIKDTENILRGRIFCGHCGKPLNRHRDNKQGTYSFSCIANQRIKKDACTGSVYIRENHLFDIILTIVRQEARNVIGVSLQLKQRDGQIAARKESVDNEVSRLRQKTENNRRFLTSLLESFNSGILTRAEYLEMKEGYSREIRDAVERVQQLQEQQKSLESQMENYTSLADRLADIDVDATLTALLVDQLIERVTVNGPDDVSIRFRFESGFEQLMGVLADG